MITTITLAPGVTLHTLKSDKFKTACFSLNFLRPHDRENAAMDALLPSVLLRGTEKYPDIRSISSRLDELYGASLGTLVRRKGEVKLTGFYADFIEDAFLPEGETVFSPMVDFVQEVLYRPYLEKGCFCPRFVEGEKQNLMNAIASSIIGGTMLTGGVGNIIGTLFGVLSLSLIQNIVSSVGLDQAWWTGITIAAMLCVFLVVQSIVISRKKNDKSADGDTAVAEVKEAVTAGASDNNSEGDINGNQRSDQ